MSNPHKTLGGQIIEKAITEYLKFGGNKYGKDWKAPLARDIFNSNPTIFKSPETVRYIIRSYTGNAKGSRTEQIFHTDKYGKILILDIETAPILTFVFGMWEQNIQHDFIQSDWFIFTWSAKWLFEKKVYSGKLTPAEAKNQDDKRIMQSIWELIDEADIVITHNGDKFDIKKLNTRFLIHGMHPPMPFISIDTLKHSRKQFAHSSNKLDYINGSLHIRKKMKHEGASLWVKCYWGNKKALDKMEKYNCKDVLILEELYLRIRSWIRPHPNLGIYITEEKVVRCPTCGSDDLTPETGRYATQTATYGVCRCKKCGSLSAGRVNQLGLSRAKYLRKAK